MRAFYRVVSMICIILLLISVTCGVSATSIFSPITEMERLSLIQALQDVELQKQAWGLDDTDFLDLRLGYPVSTYNYTNDGLVPGNKLYPIIADDELLLWAILHDGNFQISTGLVNLINNAIASNTEFALIYDRNSVYAYSDNGIYFLQTFENEDTSRAVLQGVLSDLFKDVTLTSLSNSIPLGFEMVSNFGINSRSANYVCNVSFVSQAIPGVQSNICWAACVASIRNYKQGTLYTAVDVARNYYGSNYNRTIVAKSIENVLSDNGLPYYYLYSYGDFESEILDSIIAGYPTVGIFCYQNALSDNHATVIYGINPIAARIRIMDPNAGMISISSTSNGYSYTDTTSNQILTLGGAICYSL